jgi:undecaprenyl-diphosphatase
MSESWFIAVVLGALQGLTEFLPVSSDGHLALAQILFGVQGGGLGLTVMLHAGTLVATVLVLRAELVPALRDGIRGLVRPAIWRVTTGGRDALVVLFASLPTAAIGLGLDQAVDRWTESPLVVGLGFCFTTLVLASTRWVRNGEATHPTPVGALLLGVAQGLAVLPGVSRSGSTIALALWLGVRRERAFTLSMLMSLPAILGAVLLKVPTLVRSPGALGSSLVGALVAALVGVVALLLLRWTVVRGSFSVFALWTLPLALATLAMALAWPS